MSSEKMELSVFRTVSAYCVRLWSRHDSRESMCNRPGAATTAAYRYWPLRLPYVFMTWSDQAAPKTISLLSNLSMCARLSARRAADNPAYWACRICLRPSCHLGRYDCRYNCHSGSQTRHLTAARLSIGGSNPLVNISVLRNSSTWVLFSRIDCPISSAMGQNNLGMGKIGTDPDFL